MSCAGPSVALQSDAVALFTKKPLKPRQFGSMQSSSNDPRASANLPTGPPTETPSTQPHVSPSPVVSPSSEHPALLQHPQFQALYRQLLLSLNQHGWRDGVPASSVPPLGVFKRPPGSNTDYHGSSTSTLPLTLADPAGRRTWAENHHAQHAAPPAAPAFMNTDLRQIQQNLQHQLATLHHADVSNQMPSHFSPFGYASVPTHDGVRNYMPPPHISAAPPMATGPPGPSLVSNVQSAWMNAPPQSVRVPHMESEANSDVPRVPTFTEGSEKVTEQTSRWQESPKETDAPRLPMTIPEAQSVQSNMPLDMEDPEEVSTSGPLKSDVDHHAESRHFREVCQAFATYESMAMIEVSRMDRHFHALSDYEKTLLIEPVADRMEKIKSGVATNQRFLNLLISQDLDIVDDELGQAEKGGGHSRRSSTEATTLQGLLTEFNRGHTGKYEESCSSDYQFCDPIEPGCAIEDCEVSSMNMYKVRSTLKQFAREWSAERAVEREAAFKPLLQALDDYLPLATFKAKQGRVPWVLCPGSGLGRLPFEVVSKGYSCQGNEFSYFMLLGSNFILNHALEPASISLVPFCLNSCNRREHEDHLQVIKIPDICAADGVAADVDFSMCAGDFVEVYTPQKEAWDAVLTCFFLDTAKNIICYIHTIANIVPTGGLWANMGPLLYHFADSVTEMSVELSWEEIRKIITIYFEIKEERWIDAFYTTPPRSMLQALYHCIFFVAIRNEAVVPPETLMKSSSATSPPTLTKSTHKAPLNELTASICNRDQERPSTTTIAHRAEESK